MLVQFTKLILLDAKGKPIRISGEVGLTSQMWLLLPVGCFIAGLLLGLAL